MSDVALPATKGDLKHLATKQDLQDLRSDLEQKMTVMGQNLEQKMKVMGQNLEQKMAGMQQETMRYVALGFETFRHDFLSVHHDEVVMLKEKDKALDTRVCRIEDSLGMAA